MLRTVAATIALALVMSPLTAQAYEQATTNLAVNGSTVRQTQPSGLWVDYVIGGSNIDGLAGTTNLGSKGATATTFSPTVSRTTPTLQMDVPYQGCTRPAKDATTYCVNRGTITMNFLHPTRDPILHLAGLGGNAAPSSSTGNNQGIVYSAALKPTGSTPTPTVLTGNNLQFSNGYIQAANVKTSGSCSTNLTTMGGVNVSNGSSAACGSVQFTGTFSQLTFQVDMQATCLTTGSQATGCGNVTLDGSSNDQFVMVATTGLDFGDAPVSYNGAATAAAPAAAHAVGSLRLGSVQPDDDGTAGNPTQSPVAVAAGADNNGPDNGDYDGDEDAFASLPDVLAQGTSPYTLTVPISGTVEAGQVSGWIDFNRNNVFDTGEKATAAFNAGATSVALSFTKAAGLTTGVTYARFRVANEAASVNLPNGLSPSGEVEDYRLSIVNESAALDLVKSAGAVQDTNGDGIDSAGDKVTYTFTVTNNGNTAVSGIAIADPKIPGVTCSATTLAVGASTSCTGTYTLTQTDVNAGTVANTATVTGTTSLGTAVTKTASTNRSVAQVTRASLTKTAGTLTDPDGNGPDVGDAIPYSFVVTNTGNVPLTAASVTDPKITGVTCPTGTLAPGASKTCTGTYTLTQADVNAGKVDNFATATVTSAAGTFTTPAATATKTFTPTSSYTFDKQAGPLVDTDGNGPDVGDTIAYSFVFLNTGTTTLNTPAVTDTKIGAVTCAAGTAEPGSSITCTKTYTLTQADVDSGAVNNTATGVIRNPAGTNLASQTDSTSTTVTPSNLVKLTKTAGAPNLGSNGRADPGDTITYTFVVENTGTSTLTNPTVNDPKVGAITCATGSLAPGASVTCTPKVYALTQADIDAGKVDNSATASATRPNNTVITSAASAVSTTITRLSTVTFAKSASSIVDANTSGKVDAGDTIQYSFTTVNTGNTTLTGLTVNDGKVGTVTCSPTSLSPGATVVCTKVYTLTQTDVDSGAVNNTATATVTPPAGAAITSASSSTSTPITAAATMTLAKTPGTLTDPDGNGPDVGDVLPYSFVVTNTGTATINGITVSDPKLSSSPLVCSPASLAPNDTATCAGSYTLTQSDVDAGKVDNSATANGTKAGTGGGAVSANRTATKTFTPTSAFAFDKQVGAVVTGADGRADVGDAIPYTFVFTNSGTTTLSAPTVTDAKVGPVTCPTGSLAPGASVSCTKSYLLTQADLDSGAVNNTATATMNAPPGLTAPASQSDSTSLPITAANALALTKTAGAVATGADGRADVGDTITYTFLVTNQGNQTLSAVAVSDPKVGPVTCTPTTLAPGASVTCSKSYALTQADIDLGRVDNTATATGRTPGNATVTSNTPSVTRTVTAAPAVVLDKQVGTYTDVNANGRTDVGDTIAYGFVIQNTGNVTLDPITVNDVKVGAVTCPTGPLAPGATRTCTPKTYTITQADVDLGAVNNTATVTARPPVGAAFTSAPDTTSTPTTDVRTLSVTETAGAVNDVDGNGTDVGDTVAYTLKATNTGTKTISGVTISDPKLPGLTCPATSLAAGQSLTCTGTYTLTQADVDAGVVNNTATATGTDPGGATVTGTGTNAKSLTGTSTFIFGKSAGAIAVGADGRADVGDTIAYTFTFTNTGTTTLKSPTVSDAKIGPVTCPAGAVAPGATVSCTKSYALTQTDIDSGAVNNTATGAMTANAAGSPAPSPATRTDSTSSPITPANALTLTKTAGAVATGPDGRADVGDTITYTFVVKNTGNQNLSTVAVSDPKVGPVACTPTDLAPGASVTCSKAYALTQNDIDLGKVDNTATATARNLAGTTVTSNTPSVSTTVAAAPAAVLDKQVGTYTDVNDNGRTDVGDTILFGFVIQNSGNVTLDPITVNDPKVGAVTCPTGPLAPGDSRACTPKLYTITQADVDLGAVANSATVTAKPPVGAAFTSAPDTTSTPTTDVRTLSVSKTAGAVNDLDGNGPDAGDTIAYTITATNTGTRTITAVAVTDPKLPGLTCSPSALAAGQATTCTGTYTLTQGDIDAGVVTNTASASGLDPAGNSVTASGSNSRTLVASSTFVFDKQAGTPTDSDGDGAVEAGDTIAYAFVFTNTGATTLKAPTVTDAKVGAVTCPAGAVAPGDSVTCTKTYTLSQADVDAGAVNNTATGAMTPNNAGSPVPVPATRTDSTSSPLAPANTLELAKTAAAPVDANGSNRLDAGDTILYTFTLTNRGNTTLTGATLNDPKLGAVSCPAGSFAPGQTKVCTKTYTLSQADLDAGSVQNTATAAAVDPKGTSVPSNTSTVTSPLTAAPSIAVDKQAGAPTDANGNGRVDAGDTITYGFVVENTGNVTVDPVTVSDPKVGPVTCPSGALAPGATRTCAPVTYTITQADADSGAVLNTATVTATPPTGPAVTGTDSTSTSTTQQSELSLTKTAGAVNDVDGNGTDVGDTVPYTITVTNTGTKTISGLVTTDPKIPGLTCSATSLAAGQASTCTGSYTLTQADVDAGKVDNSASTRGADPAGVEVTATGTSTKTLQPVSSFVFDKQAGPTVDANGSNRLDAGDTIAYDFVFTNTGTTSLRTATVSDAKVGPVTCATGSVAPGASVTCTKVYTLTQADIDAGAVNNTATGALDSPPGRPAPTPPTRTDSTSSTLAPGNTLTMTKSSTGPVDANANGRPDVDELVTYSFTVRNTGNQTLTLLTIMDPKVGSVTCPSTTIAPDQTITCSKTYPLKQADIDNGGVQNSAFATASTPGGGAVSSNTSTITTSVTRSPAVAVDKQAEPPVDVNGNGMVDAGDTIRYSFVVQNTGNTSFDQVTVNDPKLGAIVCPTGSVTPGTSVTCTPKTYTITQGDADSGAVANSATVTVTPTGLTAITSAPDTTSTPTTTVSSLQLTKTAGVPIDSDGNGPDVGDLLPYTFAVRNTGTTTLTGVAITDPKISGPITCAATTIAPGQTATCSGNHVLTQSEIDAGKVDNTATATATAPGNTPVTGTGSTTKAVVPVSSFVLDKQAGARADVDGDGEASEGDTIAYTFVFTNSGATTLSAPAVSDPLVPGVVCPAGAVPPDGQVSCEGTYTLTQRDIDAGAVNNTATGTMVAPPNTPQPVAKTDGTSTELPGANRLELQKTAAAPVDVDGDDQIGAGDTVAYTFRVTNSGNQTLTDVGIDDPTVGAVTCPTGDLPPLAEAPLNVVECTKVYVLTQADIDLGGVVNTAAASAVTPEGDRVLSPQDSVETDIDPTPGLELDKQAGPLVDVDGNGPDRGDTIDYTFVLQNTGNVTLDDVVISDLKVGPITCPTGPLAPQGTRTCGPFTYTLTQADIDGGAVDNTATATANDPGGVRTTTQDTTSTPSVGSSSLATVKKAGALTDPDANGVDAGDVLSYDFTLTNTGTTSLTVVSVTDEMLGGTFACSPTTLAPGGVSTCSGAYTLTQADVDAGEVSNTATGSARDPEGGTVSSTTTITTPLAPTSSFDLDKRAGAIALGADGRPSAGDTITYGFVFTNTGGTTLRAPAIDDPLLGTVVCPPTTVLPGASTSCTAATYTLTQADIDSGSINNTATGTMTAPVGTPAPAADSDSTSTPIAATPSLTLTKTAGPVATGPDGRADVGDTITYSFTATNTGNRTVAGLTVTDAKIATITCPDTTLSPGEPVTCSGTYTLTQADLDAGAVLNTATASATDPAGTTVTSPSAAAETDLVRVVRGSIDKAVSGVQDVNGNGATDAGDTITYTFVLTNVGNTTLDPDVISDPKVGPLTCPSGPLAPGASLTCTPKVYTVTSQDVLSGAVQNTATATVTGPDGSEHESQDSTSTTTRAQPIARDDASTGKQGLPQSVDPLANDIAGDPTVPLVRSTVTLLDAAGVPAATVTVAAGVYSVDGNRIVFTPNPAFTGTPAAVTYRVADAKGNQVTARYQPQVTAVDPVAVDDESTGLQGRPQTVAVLGNDTAGDVSAPLDPATVALLDADGDSVDSLVVPGVGRYDVVGATVVFTPEPAYTGTPPAVRYQVADRNGTLATAEIAVSVTAVTPTADDDTAMGRQGLPLTIDVLANDRPGNPLVALDRDSLTLLDEDGDPVAFLLIDGVGRYDVVDGALVLTPDPMFSGPVPPVGYRIADVNGTTASAVVTTTITAVAPQAADDVSTRSQGRPQSVEPLENDSAGDPDVPLDPTSLTLLDANGDPATTVTVTGGVYTLSGTTIIFTPDPAYTGTPSAVAYRVADANGTTTTARHRPTVTPVTRPDSSGGLQGLPQSVDPLANDDRDPAVVLDATTLALIDPDTGLPTDQVTITGQGTYAVDAGRITFTPVPTFSGRPTPIAYVVRDQTGASLSDTYAPVVTSLTPGANPDVASGPQGLPVTVEPLFNDNPGNPSVPLDPDSLTLLDADGNPTETVTVAGGVYTLDGTTITFTPERTFVGTAPAVDYRVADRNGTTARSTFTPTLTAVTPDAFPDATSGPQGVPQSVDPLANDVAGDADVPLDPDSLTLLDADGNPTDTVTVAGGVYTLDGTTITFTPDLTFVGTAPPVSYRVADRNGTTDTSTYRATSTRVTPVANPDTSTGTQGAPQSVSPLDNDVAGDPDVDFDTATLTLLDAGGAPAATVAVTGGTYTLAGGVITFTPEPDYTGDPAPVRYRVADENGTVVSSTYLPSVAPVTRPDESVGLQGANQSVDPLANDTLSPVVLDATTLTLLDPATGETADEVEIPNQGTYRVEAGRIVFDPLSTFTGAATPIEYRVDDAAGNTLADRYAPTVLSLTPGLGNDATFGPQGVAQTVDPLDNDEPGDPTVPLDPATLTLLDADGDPTDRVTVDAGTYVLADGTITFTPDRSFVGTATPVTYRVADENGTTSTATYAPTFVVVTPIARDDVSTGKQGASQTVQPLANDSAGDPDVDLDPTSLTLLDADGDPTSSVTVAAGTYTIDGTGIDFVPDPSFTGTATPVTYRVADVNGTTVTATYRPTVTAVTPIARPDATTGKQGATQLVEPLANDSAGDPDVDLDPASLTLLDADGDPAATVTVAAGTYVLADGTITFTPDPTFVGTADPVAYRVADTNGTAVTSRYTATVTAVTPIARGDASTGKQGASQSVDPLANDDAGDPDVDLDPSTLTLLDVDGDRATTVEVDGGSYTITGGRIVFTPDPTFTGNPPVVTYEIRDANGTPATATYAPTVTAVTPIARDDESTGRQGAEQSVDPLANDDAGDPDVDLDPTTLTLLAAGGDPAETVDVDGGSYTITGGRIVFTPDPSFVGTAPAVSYEIRDANGTPATATYTPTVTAVTPIARDDESTGRQGAPQSVDPLLNDEPGDDDVPLVAATLRLRDADGAPAATVAVDGGSYSIVAGRIVFTPAPTFVGTAPAVTYEVRDANGTPATATYTPAVTAVTPIARDDESTGRQGAEQLVDPLANDSAGDPDVDLDPTSLTLLDADGDPATTVTVDGGTYRIVDGRIVFTPVPTFTGTAPPVTYRVADENGTTDTAEYAPTVTAVTPSAVADTSTGRQGATQSVDPLANDEPGNDDVPLVPASLTLLDADGDPATTVTVAGGSYSIVAGRIVFTPAPTFVGDAPPVTYRVADENGTTDTATYTPTVTAVTPAPVNDISFGRQGATQSVDPLDNDGPGAPSVPLDPTTLTLLDADGDPATVVDVDGGRYTLAGGTITFTPDRTFTGPAPAVTYEIRDANGTPATATYTPTVTEVVPTAEPDESTGIQGATQSVDPLLNDEPGDPDVALDPTTLTLLDASGDPTDELTVAAGTYTITDGRIVFRPVPTFTGLPTPAGYSVADDNGTTVRSTYQPTVTAVTPSADDDTSTGLQGAAQSVDPLANDEPGNPTVPLDPTSLTLLDVNGNPATSVTVIGGVYTIVDGRIVFTPTPAFTGTAPAVRYRVADENGTTDTAQYAPVVTAVTPTAQDDTTTGLQGKTQSVDPLLNDEPGDDDVPLDPTALTLLGADGDPTTSVAVAGGTYAIAGTLITFTPDPTFVGDAPAVTYRVADENGTTATATYAATVTAVTPVARDDSSTGRQGATQSVDPLVNDEPGNPTVPLVASSLTLLDAEGDPAATVEVDGGTYSIVGGRIVFTPDAGFSGTPDPVRYRVADVNGSTDTAEYAPVVAAVTPTAGNDASTGKQGSPQSVDPLANDAPGNPDVPLVPASLTLLDAEGDPASTVEVDGGTYSIAGGRIVFTPEPTFSGIAPAVDYQVADANGSLATASYTPTVTPITPTAAPDFSSALQGSPQSVDPLANDAAGDPDVPLDPATLTLLDLDGNPATTVAVTGGTYRIVAGRIVFTPVDGFSGDPVPVGYRVADENATAVSSTYQPTVVAVVPVARLDEATGVKNRPVSVDPLANDSAGDPSVPLVASSLTLLDAEGNPATAVEVDGGTYTITGGRIVFTPDIDYVGTPDPVTYRVADENGTTATSTFNPVIDDVSTVLNDDATRGAAGQTQSVDPLANDVFDADHPVVARTLTLLDAEGEPATTVTVTGGSYRIANGRIVFTPAAGFAGTAEPVTYRVADVDGVERTATYTPTVVTSAPSASNDTSTGRQGAVQSVDPLANDTAGGPSSPLVPSTLSLLDAAGEPTTSVEVEGGVYTIEDGRIVFTPELGFVGTATPVRYRVGDVDGRTATARYTPTVSSVRPVAVNDSSTGLIGEPQSVDPLANDRAGDTTVPLDPASLRLLNANGNPVATVSVEGGVYSIVDGRIVFTPEAGFVGAATPVRYQVADVNGTLAVARYTPTVGDGAIVEDITKKAPAGTAVTFDPVARTPDLDPSSVRLIDPDTGDEVTRVVVSGQGVWTVDGDTGRITFTPANGLVGDPTPIGYVGATDDGTAVRGELTVDYPGSTTPTPTPTPGGGSGSDGTGTGAGGAGTGTGLTPGSGSGTGSNGIRLLPGTGVGDLVVPLGLLGLVMLGVGIVVVRRRTDEA